MNVYVVSNLAIQREVILGREFINVCPLLKPGLDLMNQVAKETTLKRITRLEDLTFNVDFIIRKYTEHNEAIGIDALDLETIKAQFINDLKSDVKRQKIGKVVKVKIMNSTKYMCVCHARFIYSQ